ncbi:MAG: nitroreductase family protein [Oscillospiraceae bacterium]|nr:nitroreductase family protein [Oscillospiraceae bacterium]
MNTMDAISSRRSYRGRFLPDPVPREDLMRILEAGAQAPSGCNRQTTSFLAVDDPDVLTRLHAVIDPPVGQTAPAAVCVLTRRLIAYRDRTFYIQDYSAAIENLLLAITDLGYASCWYEGHITDTDRICDRMAQILNVPGEYELVAFLPVGIPAEEAAPVRKQPLSRRIFVNTFGNTPY